MMKSAANRPSKGRAFPLSMAEARELVVQHKLLASDGSRLSVIFRNPSPSEAKEDLVAEFRPGVQLALVSLPVATNREESAEVWRSILAACFTLAARKLAPGSGPAPVYVFFGAVSPLSVVERIYHYQTRKYRATDKFTGGLNRKLIRLEEKRIS